MAQRSTSPVPLYLLPQALSKEIKKYGDTNAEVRIQRTTGHTYVLKVKHDEASAFNRDFKQSGIR